MSALPEGPLIAWYGDDFTGAVSNMEAMTFAGLPAVVFLEPPTQAMLALFPGMRGIGIAGTARSETPEWMGTNLPVMYRGLVATGAPILQYKICSTLDSSPQIGSIGAAMDIAREVLSTKLFPILPAAPPIGRYQAFGNLFAYGACGVFRLDRHPAMASHPVTPMRESDVAMHLLRQISIPIDNLSLVDIQREGGPRHLIERRGMTATAITLDATSMADIEVVGRLIWEARGPDMFCIASQGLQYALIAHWRSEGLLPEPLVGSSVGHAGPVAVVSGSVSPTTQSQIAHAEKVGFTIVPVTPETLVRGEEEAVEIAVKHAVSLIEAGRDVLLCTARGIDDPAVARFTAWQARQSLPATVQNRRVGEGLGEILLRVVRATGLKRVIISGGDTSGHAVRRLGLFALTALAPTVPGAALCLAHSERAEINGLQLALKGGQMGTPDYFSWIRDGAGRRT